ncbi:GGDEF domain-containing protein [Sporosarcina sp. FSL W7-1349]|uniref:GGDEF domain-containing protein n=1 Tax=Sporosarcina sp. FSL W7-1349 TaxID=2921561 RepID=UPI0030F6B405
MVQSILSNLAIILLGHLLMSTLMNYRGRFTKVTLNCSIVLLFSTVVIAMFYLPIRFDANYQVDLRLIPLLLLAIFRGWKITLPVLVISSAWRLGMGGLGAVPGVLYGMALPTLLTLLYLAFRKKRVSILESALIVSICWFVSDVPIVWIVPNGVDILKEISPLRYLSFLGATFVYYAFIQLEYKKEALRDELVFLASHDSLTKLLNKQSFIGLVEERMQDDQTEHYIAMVDIDHFKNLNDSYGHLAGDQALIAVSSIFERFESEDLIVARYGGEEFIIYMRADRQEHAIRVMEDIRNAIRTTPVPINEKQSLSVFVSIGLARIVSGSSLQEAIHLADKQLYQAKEQGRDRISYS